MNDKTAPPKQALICGVTGQDGSYLAQLLLQKGYSVYGTSRDAQASNRHNLKALGIEDRVETLSMVPTDFRSVLTTLAKSTPDEIYYLAGQTSVGLSFEQPAETLESISHGVLNLLEAIRFEGRGTKFYHAGSSECFGDLNGQPANESTPFRPRSPYAVAKASAHWLVANYREAYDIYACNGILFNHESPLRPQRFVTRKIIAGVKAIRDGRASRLMLGRLDISRDWGWAPEFVQAMWLMLQHDTPDDYVIATGCTVTLQQFVEMAFSTAGLDWQNHVDLDPGLARPTDLSWNGGDPSHAREKLGWSATVKVEDVIRLMMDAECLRDKI